MATPIAATQAYANIARLSESAGLGKGAGDAVGGQNFGSMLKDVVGSIAETAKNSDTQTQAMAAGKANVVDVVTAVAETEVAIDALVAVRDRVIQAYEEIMRMPI
jgi:flagellar hook-basal body complex protein FliE